MATNLLVSLRIRAFDSFSRVTGKLKQTLREVSKAQERASKTFALAGNINQASVAVGKFASVARSAVEGPIKKAMAFEQAMVNVKAVTKDITEKQFKAMSAEALRLGSTTKFTAIEAAEGMKFLAIAGFTAKEQMEALSPVLQLAQAGSTDLGRASDIASDLLGAFGLEASDMREVGDVLTATFTSSNTTLETLFETMKLSAPIARSLNIGIREVAAMTGVMGSAGLKGSQAGTAMRQMFLKLSAQTPQATKVLKGLGIETRDLAGNLLAPTNILAQLVEKTEGLGTATRTAALSTIFGARATTGITTMLASMKKGELQTFLADLQKVDGTMERIQKLMQDTGVGAATSLNSAIEGLSITLGSVFNEELKGGINLLAETVREITKWLRVHPALTAAIFGTMIVAAGLLTILQGLLVVISTFLAAKGILILAGGFKKLALAMWAVSAPLLAIALLFGSLIFLGLTIRDQWANIRAELKFLGIEFDNFIARFEASSIFSKGIENIKLAANIATAPLRFGLGTGAELLGLNKNQEEQGIPVGKGFGGLIRVEVVGPGIATAEGEDGLAFNVVTGGRGVG